MLHFTIGFTSLIQKTKGNMIQTQPSPKMKSASTHTRALQRLSWCTPEPAFRRSNRSSCSDVASVSRLQRRDEPCGLPKVTIPLNGCHSRVTNALQNPCQYFLCHVFTNNQCVERPPDVTATSGPTAPPTFPPGNRPIIVSAPLPLPGLPGRLNQRR